MSSKRPPLTSLIGQDPKEVPMSCQRVLQAISTVEPLWIGLKNTIELSHDDLRAYELAHKILCHIAIQAPTKHQSGHPGGPLSSFTFAYFLRKRRNPQRDQPLRMSAGHLSLLAYGLQWLFGCEGNDPRLQSPQAIIETFRTPSGLPGHAEAGIGDIPFGAGPLGKGVSNALGAAFGLRYRKEHGIMDVLMADGDCQEGQIMEAFRLASRLKLDNLIVHGDFNDVQLSDLPSQTVAPDFALIAEACGWQVIEVQNGNDPKQVVAALDVAEQFLGKGRPLFLCYYTTMGQGVRLMEEGSNTGKQNFHGTPLTEEEAQHALQELPPLEELIAEYEPYRQREKARSLSRPTIPTDFPLSWNVQKLREYQRTIMKDKSAARKDFGAVHLRNLMRADPRILVLHADLAGSGGFDVVAKEFPDRVINVGVAEANMAMMAAGLRQVGLLPVAYTFAAFGTNEARANVRLIDINCGHTRCAVLFDCTHTGVSVGEDGETHQERHYLNLPFDHTQVWMPADSNQAGAMAEKALELVAEGHTNVFVFTGRTSHPQLLKENGDPVYDSHYVFDGRATMLRGAGDTTDDITILAVGPAVHEALKAADLLTAHSAQLSARILNIASLRPIDASAVIQAALETLHLIVVEDHCSEGGLATQIADIIADFQLPCSLRRLGVNHYFPSGSAKDLFFLAGLDAEHIAETVEDELRVEVCGGEDILMSCLTNLPQHLKQSRFQREAEPFVERLKRERGYLEHLRDFWKKRACPKEKLPRTEHLRQML